LTRDPTMKVIEEILRNSHEKAQKATENIRTPEQSECIMTISVNMQS